MLKISDNTGKEYTAAKNGDAYSLAKTDIAEGIEYIDFIDDSLFAQKGDSGYYVIADYDKKGSRLCFFNDKADGERILKQDLMPIFGVKKNGRCVLVIVEGYKYDFHLVLGVKGGEYYIYPRFYLNGDIPYEDISIRVAELEADADYSDMASYYREYQLKKGACRPLSERINERESLRYAMESPEIRIRMGWKPAPSPVAEQTPENEPEMKVACTFDRVCDLIDELKAQDVDKAQICLVGWNKSGHDGRWPQIFPVEPAFGGEERLKHLIEYGQKNGYQIVCHTNSTDTYHIADTFSMDEVIKKKDGSPEIDKNVMWSGGRPYKLCPQKAVDYAEKYLPRVRALGFEGLHYIDILTVVPLWKCYDKKHPSNSKETLDAYYRIMELSQSLFGGFSSEGCFDFGAKYLDYGLYVSWPATEDYMYDKIIPLWQMVYHGIILYNATTDTVNYPIKDRKRALQIKEDGTRPSFYFYSKFLTGSNQDDWLGKEDMTLDTDEDIKYNVSKIKEAYDEYKSRKNLWTEFIVKHRETSENVVEVTYSDGTVITVDYN